MRVLALLPVVAALTDRIAGPREILKGIAAKGHITEGDKVLIQGFLDTLHNTLYPALRTEADDTRGILNVAFDAVEQCLTDRGATFAGNVAAKAGDRDASRDAHMTCKGVGNCPSVVTSGLLLSQWPASGFNYSYDVARNWGQEDTAQDFTTPWADNAAFQQCVGNSANELQIYNEQIAHCETLDDFVRNTLHGSTGVRAHDDWCNMGTHHIPADVATDVAHQLYDWETATCEGMPNNDDVVHTWFHFMDGFTNNHYTTYKAHRSQCHSDRRAHTCRTKRCHHLQAEFERDFCAWRNSIDNTCYNYEVCYLREDTAFDTEVGLAAAIEVQLKAQQMGLECLMCYGDQILQTERIFRFVKPFQRV